MTTAADPSMARANIEKLSEVADLLAKGAAPDIALARAWWLQVDGQWHAWSDAERQQYQEIRDRWRSLGERAGWV